jgi:hypothetical protein
MKAEHMYLSRDGGEIHFETRESAELRAQSLATEHPKLSFRVEKESEGVYRIYYKD